MDKIYKILLLIIFSSSATKAQQYDHTIVLKSIADNVLREHNFKFVDHNTGEEFTNLQGVDPAQDIRFKSRYLPWRYWNGVLNMAMSEFGDLTGDSRYMNYASKNYEFIFENKWFFEKRNEIKKSWSNPLHLLFRTEELDDCGALGAGLIEIYQNNKNKAYREYIDEAARHIMKGQHRLDDGTLSRTFPVNMTIWADDLYMSVPFLARMGKLTNDSKYFDEAVKQVIQFNDYLYNPANQLYFHGWYSDNKQNNVAHWGRCNGWVVFAEADLLQYLPQDHPKRDRVIAILRNHLIGISRFQARSGLWHQLLDRPDSYLETSASAMFTYAIAKAVNNGWIEDRYIDVAINGWKGINTMITGDGNIENICQGTMMYDDLESYYNRKTPFNDIHGIGAVLLAGVEIEKYLRSNNKKD